MRWFPYILAQVITCICLCSGSTYAQLPSTTQVQIDSLSQTANFLIEPITTVRLGIWGTRNRINEPELSGFASFAFATPKQSLFTGSQLLYRDAWDPAGDLINRASGELAPEFNVDLSGTNPTYAVFLDYSEEIISLLGRSFSMTEFELGQGYTVTSTPTAAGATNFTHAVHIDQLEFSVVGDTYESAINTASLGPLTANQLKGFIIPPTVGPNQLVYFAGRSWTNAPATPMDPNTFLRERFEDYADALLGFSADGFTFMTVDSSDLATSGMMTIGPSAESVPWADFVAGCEFFDDEFIYRGVTYTYPVSIS